MFGRMQAGRAAEQRHSRRQAERRSSRALLQDDRLVLESVVDPHHATLVGERIVGIVRFRLSRIDDDAVVSADQPEQPVRGPDQRPDQQLGRNLVRYDDAHAERAGYRGRNQVAVVLQRDHDIRFDSCELATQGEQEAQNPGWRGGALRAARDSVLDVVKRSGAPEEEDLPDRVAVLFQASGQEAGDLLRAGVLGLGLDQGYEQGLGGTHGRLRVPDATRPSSIPADA